VDCFDEPVANDPGQHLETGFSRPEVRPDRPAPPCTSA
jgi:hypothetical protein